MNLPVLLKNFFCVKRPLRAILLSFVFLAIFVIPALAIETQTMSAYPTNSYDSDPRSRSWFIYSLAAGVVKNDSITVSNNGKEPVTLKVYPVDSTTTSDGQFALENEGDSRDGMGAWVKLEKSEITLSPNEKKNIKFTVSIPENTPKGEHSGGIVFEDTKLKKMTKKGPGVNIKTRVGVRIYETVPGDEQLNLSIKDLRYSVINNFLTFNFKVENNGTVHVSPTGIFEVKDMFGRVIQTYPLEEVLGVVVPNNPKEVTIPTKILAPMVGWNTAKVAVYYSPTKAAVKGMTFMPNAWGAFFLATALFLFVAVPLSKKYLYKRKGNAGTVVLAPHVKVAIAAILLGAIAFSGLVSLILTSVFGGR